MEISEHIAVVTGGGSGLGRLIAERLAHEGAHVVVADRDAAAASSVVDALRVGGAEASAVRADMTEPGDVALLMSLARDLGRLRVLVNNAGGWGGVSDHYPAGPASDWRRVMELNLLGPMLATQLALGPIQAAGGGCVVNVSSVAGTQRSAYPSPPYAVAKAGLVRLTTTLAGLRVTHGVRVGCVVPGWIGLGRAQSERAAMTESQRSAAGPLVPPGDVVEAVLGYVHDRHPGLVLELDGSSRVFLDLPRDDSV